MLRSLNAHKSVFTLAVLTAVLFTAPMAKADSVIVSNLTTTFQDNQGPLTTSNWFGNSFTNTTLMDLTKITLLDSGSHATASLYSDSAGKPGVDLGDLVSAGNSADVNGNGAYFFTPTGTIALNPNTTYWVVSSGVPTTSDTYWDFTNDTTPNIGLGAFSGDGGSNWNALSYTFQFEVDGVTPNVTATPEPGTWGLFGGLGLTGISAFARRRRRKQ